MPNAVDIYIVWVLIFINLKAYRLFVNVVCVLSNVVSHMNKHQSFSLKTFLYQLRLPLKC